MLIPHSAGRSIQGAFAVERSRPVAGTGERGWLAHRSAWTKVGNPAIIYIPYLQGKEKGMFLNRTTGAIKGALHRYLVRLFNDNYS